MYLIAAVGTVFEIATFPSAKVLHSRYIENVFFSLIKKKFQKLKNPFLIEPEWSILAKGKVAISKTVATAAFGYIIIHNNT